MTKMLGTNQEAIEKAHESRGSVERNTHWEKGYGVAKEALEKWGLSMDIRWTGLNDVADHNFAIVLPDGVEIHFVPVEPDCSCCESNIDIWVGKPA